MKRLIKKINTTEDYNNLLDILSKRVRDNQPISENGMYDGLIIGIMIDKKKFVESLLFEEHLDRVLDGTIQQLEHVVNWLDENEHGLLGLLK